MTNQPSQILSGPLFPPSAWHRYDDDDENEMGLILILEFQYIFIFIAVLYVQCNAIVVLK